MKSPESVERLVAGIRGGDRAALGRALTLVESNRPSHRVQAQELLASILPLTGEAHRVGITGVPGVGKSTFIESFGLRMVETGHTVAVLAVDPSSTRSGGSITSSESSDAGPPAKLTAMRVRPTALPTTRVEAELCPLATVKAPA